MEAPGTWSCQLTAAPGHQSDSALACSSAPHPSDPQPPNLTTKRGKTDIPTLLSADILALLLQFRFADPLLWNLFRLTDEVRVDCWYIVESRHWFIRMVAKDYDAELEQLDQEHSAELDG